MTELLVNLRDPSAANAARFGPKAANQALLGHAGLPIPAGFCLDVAAYRLQLKSLGLLVAARNAATAGGESARQSVSEVRIGLFDGPITPAVQDPLLRAWHSLVRETGSRVVVRSSALSEDLADSSFAGQYETFLGIETEAEFLTAVRACWAALWSPRALRYMESHKISLAETAMGLCVQELVEARVSGGGLSQTTNGNRSLTAAPGLGEAIAQGETVPDQYILGAGGELLDSIIGRSEHTVHCAHHGGPGNPPIDSTQSVDRPCLSPTEAGEIANYLQRAEELLGVPVEIEWAIDALGCKILQARPIATGPDTNTRPDWSHQPGLTGQPSGTGWAAGPARVINCECELSRVGPGDVLITRIASPSLSQVLPRVAGVVAELGGSTSHLASLARERGIPMVLGVLAATRKIPDGVQVGVDGVIGMVRWEH